jgi:putative oxidoreductase
MNAAVAPMSALGRLLIPLIFIRAGINKLGAIAATSATMGSHGIPYPDILVWGAIVLELGGGLMLMAGFYARWVALALFFYTLSLALIFHAYWACTRSGSPDRRLILFRSPVNDGRYALRRRVRRRSVQY